MTDNADDDYEAFDMAIYKSIEEVERVVTGVDINVVLNALLFVLADTLVECGMEKSEIQTELMDQLMDLHAMLEKRQTIQ